MKKFGQVAEGSAQCLVYDRTGSLVRNYGRKKNLILNQGLNYVAAYAWVDCMAYAVLGHGVIPNYVSGGSTTAEQSGATVTLSGGIYTFTNTASDYGKTLRWDTGEIAFIDLVNNPASARATDAKTKTAGTFRVYDTQRTGMVSEALRSNSYVNGECGTTLDTGTGVLTLRRTFGFPANITPDPIIYHEAGLSPLGAVGNNIFSRLVFDPPVTVESGQSLHLVYDLTITVSPIAQNARVFAITGWPVLPANNTTGFEVLETWGLYGVNTNGDKVGIQTYGGLPLDANEPSMTCDFVMGADNTVAIAFGAAPVNRFVAGDALVQCRLEPYTTDSFFRNKSIFIQNDQGNKNTLRTLAHGVRASASDVGSSFLIRFDQAQTKDASHQVNLVFRYTWGRVIS